MVKHLMVLEPAHCRGVPTACDAAHHDSREGAHEVGHHKLAATRVALRRAARERPPRRREAEPGPKPLALLAHRGRDIGDPTPARGVLRGVRPLPLCHPSARSAPEKARAAAHHARPRGVDGDEPSLPSPRPAADESGVPGC
eukprot:303410-Prymnesium_polylepis.1